MVVFTNVESVDRIIYAIFSRFNEDWKNASPDQREALTAKAKQLADAEDDEAAAKKKLTAETVPLAGMTAVLAVAKGNPKGIHSLADLQKADVRIVLANPRHTVIRTSLNGGTSPTGDRAFNEELRSAWAARLPQGIKPKIGIVWSGSQSHRIFNRSIPLDTSDFTVPFGHPMTSAVSASERSS